MTGVDPGRGADADDGYYPVATAPTCGCTTDGKITNGMCVDHHSRWLAGEWLAPEEAVDLEDREPDPAPEPENVTVERGGLTDEQWTRVAALREARQTLARRGLGSGPVTADEVTRVAEYILTGPPAKALPSFTLTGGRSRTSPGWWFHDLPESAHWATVIAAIAMAVVVLVLVLA